MKKHGEQNVKHKFTQTCATEREDLTRLKESAVITSIQCLVSCQPVFQFCRRGQEGQRNLTKSSFLFLQDENSEWHATMGHDEASKTRRGGIDDTATNYEKLGRMYQRARWKSSAKRLVYTNHCLRARAITLWSDAGLSMTLLGHRNDNSLRSSSKRSLICPESTSHTSRSENASLPWEPAAISTI